MIHVLNAPEDTKRLRAIIERRQTVRWGGQECHITPRLVATIFGDGKQLIGLAPINYRPNHFVVRVHSGWNISNHASDCVLLIDHIDEIYDAVEEEYVDWPWWRMYGLKPNRDRDDDLSARVSFDDGSAWWGEEWPARVGRKKRPQRKST